MRLKIEMMGLVGGGLSIDAAHKLRRPKLDADVRTDSENLVMTTGRRGRGRPGARISCKEGHLSSDNSKIHD